MNNSGNSKSWQRNGTSHTLAMGHWLLPDVGGTIKIKIAFSQTACLSFPVAPLRCKFSLLFLRKPGFGLLSHRNLASCSKNNIGLHLV